MIKKQISKIEELSFTLFDHQLRSKKVKKRYNHADVFIHLQHTKNQSNASRRPPWDII